MAYEAIVCQDEDPAVNISSRFEFLKEIVGFYQNIMSEVKEIYYSRNPNWDLEHPSGK
jgi:hypothetical protein